MKRIKLLLQIFVICLILFMSINLAGEIYALCTPKFDIKSANSFYMYDNKLELVFYGKGEDKWIDLEDMNTGISITDLGLNEFRMDLVEYVKHNENLNKVPNGMHSVVFSDESIGLEKGVIYVLKNINNNVNIDNMNQLHPFYLVYIKEDGTVLSNHLCVKNTLDILDYFV